MDVFFEDHIPLRAKRCFSWHIDAGRDRSGGRRAFPGYAHGGERRAKNSRYRFVALDGIRESIRGWPLPAGKRLNG